MLPQITAKLMAEGANLDVQDWEGQTALHWAAREGSVDTVLYLVDNGADTAIADKQGRRYTHWVSSKIRVLITVICRICVLI